jgi:hypothetical protein
MTATCVLWVRACPDYKPLFSILDGLRADTGWRYWISANAIEVNTCDMGEDLGHGGRFGTYSDRSQNRPPDVP